METKTRLDDLTVEYLGDAATPADLAAFKKAVWSYAGQDPERLEDAIARVKP